ncbi:linear amide C-N hydrolase [Shewanella surugensis]|uniref:Linear amide C-N hydrolase n=1 Tax=Shewanella surugensis TaxID=212020 RepID=A0ABT0L7J1_9GAMM|nr:linear amide C-N hydrolase [Shewanella surugensis]MCL1123652.1 linear amide C-N hydrolase [Shewanella surugensis]
MCTNFSLKYFNLDNGKGETFVARTQELPFLFAPSMYLQNAGHTYSQDIKTDVTNLNGKQHDLTLKVNSWVPCADSLLSWTTQYSFIAMSDYLQDFVVDGLNEKGLTAGNMTLGTSEFQEPCEAEYANTILFPYLPNWILSMCGSCQDVIDMLQYDKLNLANGKIKNNLKASMDPSKGYRVSNPYTADLPKVMKAHFPVRDREGNAIVLEYIKGKLVITDLNPIGVLTNDPEIAFQQENVMNNFSGITPLDLRGLGNNFYCDLSSSGSGFSDLPGSSTSEARFVRAAMMTNFSNVAKNPEEVIGLAFHILNTVDIPLGTSRNAKNEHCESTRFAAVTDLSRLTYLVRLYDSPQVFKVDLNKLNMSQLNNQHYAIPVDKYQSIDLTDDINAKKH